MSYNIVDKAIEYRKINNSFLTKKNANIIKIELQNGDYLRLTPDHKVFTENRGWVEAANLKDDDVIIQLQ